MKWLARILLTAFVCSLLGSAEAQTLPKLVKPTGNIVRDIEAVNGQAKSVITGKPAPAMDSTAPLACDFKMVTKLTPDNLLPTMKACAQDVNNQLVSDTSRALASAQAYGCTAGASSSCSGDGDAVNCLQPALAIFKAAAIIPAVPAQDAVPATATTPAVPAVAAVPEQDPGPILLYQKYREFTLSGALTSCQSWFNGPINATAAAGLGAAATAVGAAALLPK